MQSGSNLEILSEKIEGRSDRFDLPRVLNIRSRFRIYCQAPGSEMGLCDHTLTEHHSRPWKTADNIREYVLDRDANFLTPQNSHSSATHPTTPHLQARARA